MNSLGTLPLPTDNLYKFCALTGVAIVCFSYYTVWRFSDDLIRKVQSASLASKKAMVEAEFAKTQAERTQKTVNDLKANATDEDARKEGKVPLHITDEELRKKIESLHELSRDMSLRFVEVEAANDEIDQGRTYLKFLRILGVVFATIGWAIASYGFSNWRSLQKLQD